MKAVIVETPGTLVVRDIPRPQMGDYDALCEMFYGATCTGTDQHLIAGRFPWPVTYPTVLGHESVGRVIEVGAKVRNFKPGDVISRVGTLPSPTGDYDVNWGGYAEYGIARDHQAMREDGRPEGEWTGFRVNQIVPADIDPRAATMIITWRETLSYLTRMGIGEGANVLVIGSGGNGLSFVAHAANRGATRVAMIGNAAREATTRAIGAADYYDYRDGTISDRIHAAYPDGFDYIIDAVGKAGQLDAALPYLKSGGTIGIYGIDDFGACQLTPTRARGPFTFANPGYDEEEPHPRVIAYIQQGKLDARHWLDLDHPVPLVEIHRAFDMVAQRKAIKVLVKLTPD
ncbi:MAG: zinc-dependent alcohol dehydrogenase [Armatimonadota bacterium]